MRPLKIRHAVAVTAFAAGALELTDARRESRSTLPDRFRSTTGSRILFVADHSASSLRRPIEMGGVLLEARPLD